MIRVWFLNNFNGRFKAISIYCPTGVSMCVCVTECEREERGKEGKRLWERLRERKWVIVKKERVRKKTGWKTEDEKERSSERTHGGGGGGIKLIFHLGTCHNASAERQHQMSSFDGEGRAICQCSHREPLRLSALIPAHIYQCIPQGAFHLAQTDVKGSILHPHALAYIITSVEIKLEDRGTVFIIIIVAVFL